VVKMTYYMVPRRTQRLDAYRPVGFNGGRMMPVDVHVSPDEYLITAVVPGLTADDLKIEILDDVLTLSGELTSEEDGQGDVVLQELPVGSFKRSLRFAEPLDAEKAEAQLQNGLLKLRIPKSEEARPKTIKVKAN
jgi:HSP20 family protein